MGGILKTFSEETVVSHPSSGSSERNLANQFTWRPWTTHSGRVSDSYQKKNFERSMKTPLLNCVESMRGLDRDYSVLHHKELFRWLQRTTMMQAGFRAHELERKH